MAIGSGFGSRSFLFVFTTTYVAFSKCFREYTSVYYNLLYITDITQTQRGVDITVSVGFWVLAPVLRRLSVLPVKSICNHTEVYA